MRGWPIAAVVIAVAAMALPEFAPPAMADEAALEEVYVLRSIREDRSSMAGSCAASTTGFDPYPSDAERRFSFWSVVSQTATGRIVDAKSEKVAELRGCFGPTSDRARQNFYAEIRLGTLSFRGSGECLALMIDFPEPGLFPVRCQLVLDGLAAPYVGGLLTTSTMTSRAASGGVTDPAGYTQASIATIRLWKARL